MTAELHIASLVVQALPAALDSVQPGVMDLPGAEIHAVGDTGKLVVTLETDTEAEMLDRMDAIGRLQGVLSVSLVFHQVDDVELQQ